jgi:acid phosphatase (class A)
LFRYLLTGVGLAAAIALGAVAAESGVHSVPAKTGAPAPGKLKGYLAANDIDGEAVMGPPPAMDSIRGRADRAIYLETRKLAGSPRWAQAIQDNDLWNGGALVRYACALGETLGPKTTPVTYRILQRVELDVRTVGTPPKDHYNRTRPPIGDDLPICVPREDWMKTNASYPSGHAMTGWAWALILGELEPGKLGPLMGAGDAIGDSRVICGVHYRSDVEAGRKLGATLVARLHADPGFRKDLAAAKAELAHSHTPPPANCPA